MQAQVSGTDEPMASTVEDRASRGEQRAKCEANPSVRPHARLSVAVPVNARPVPRRPVTSCEVLRDFSVWGNAPLFR